MILGIETSCDETSAAVVIDGRHIESNIIASQIDLHSKFGGVVPEIASRRHVELINSVIQEALDEAGVGFADLEGIAVTQGPGLVGSLLVGISAAKSMAYALDIPLIGTNHIEAHLYAALLEHEELEPPFLGLVASGGHTELIQVEGHGRYRLLGGTRDDAAGEAFDKVAKALNLGYPGGPIIDRLAKDGNEKSIRFPQTKIKDGSLDFSFSGLKTAVIRYIEKEKETKSEDVVASFQERVVDTLIKNLKAGIGQTGAKRIVLGGGVAANSRLRHKMKEYAREEDLEFYYPSTLLCTDNAAMIAALGYFKLGRGERSDLGLDARPNFRLGERKASSKHR